MTTFLTIGAIGVVLLLVALVLGDHMDGAFDALGGGDWFTGASLAGFLGGLGFGGAIALDLTGSVGLATAVGAAFGLLLGALAAWAVIKLRHIGDASTPSQRSLIGLSGIVITDIPVNGYGEIRVINAGHLTKLSARCDLPVPAGTEVWISESLSATAVRVEPVRSPLEGA